jgi:hypothetical protein
VLSDQFKCPLCEDYISRLDSILSPAALSGITVYSFCLDCGAPFQVTEMNGQYLIKPLDVEDETWPEQLHQH